MTKEKRKQELQIENRDVSLDLLHPHTRNYNQHSPAQIQKLAMSLTKFSQPRSIVAWQNPADSLLYILAGHGVVEAARSLNWRSVRADILLDCNETVALAYLAADNELARQSDPDQAALAALIDEVAQFDHELMLAIGYSDEEFAKLLAEVGGGAPDVEFKEYDESVADDVEMLTCPHCGKEFPK